MRTLSTWSTSCSLVPARCACRCSSPSRSRSASRTAGVSWTSSAHRRAETTNARLRSAEREALEEADRRIEETRSDAERRIREAAERAATDVVAWRAKGAHRGARGRAARARTCGEQGTRDCRGVVRRARARGPARDASHRGAGRRTRAQAAADDAQRLLSAQPLPTWLRDMETLVLHAASDSAGRSSASHPRSCGTAASVSCCRIRAFWERVRRSRSGHDPPGRRPGTPRGQAPDRLDAGRPCRPTVARDATGELEAGKRHDQTASRAALIEHTAAACCPSMPTGGDLGEPGVPLVMCLSPAEAERDSPEQFEQRTEVDATMRSAAISGDGLLRRETRWRRADGSTRDVEIVIAPVPELADARVVTVRDMSNASARSSAPNASSAASPACST